MKKRSVTLVALVFVAWTTPLAIAQNSTDPSEPPKPGAQEKTMKEEPRQGNTKVSSDEAPTADVDLPPVGDAQQSPQGQGPEGIPGFTPETKSDVIPDGAFQNIGQLEAKTAAIAANLREALQNAERLNSLLSEVPALRGAGVLRSAASQSKARTVHTLLIGDTRDNTIGAGVQANLKFISSLIDHQAMDRDKIYPEVSGNRFTSDRISAVLNQMNVTANDTLFCYVACHGAFTSSGHVFQIPQGPSADTASLMSRKSLMDRLLAKGARQTILISDSCASAISAPDTAVYELSRAAGATPTHALSFLLLFQSGVVDINGSSPPPAQGNRTFKPLEMLIRCL